MVIAKNVFYVGVNDHRIDLFEGQYTVPNGMSYNSYLIVDEKTAVMDTADAHFTDEWLDNIASVLAGREPDYLIVQHMEPDHSANIQKFAERYPHSVIVSNSKAFTMMDNFFDMDLTGRKLAVEDGGTLALGEKTLTFVFAPMVHWPEVMVTYDDADKLLFSADAFGKFGALDVDEPWDDEARRYYIGIVGKYGAQAQMLLKKAAALDIKTICPLHGPTLNKELGHYISLYDTWSSYRAETDGVVVAYTSVYGHTKAAAELLAEKLRKYGCPNVALYDLARCDMALAVAEAFRCSKLVLATTTYNADIFPFMREFIEHLTERGFQGRTVGLIENGSWAPQAANVMKELLAPCKNITLLDKIVKIKSAIKPANIDELDAMARELCREYIALSDKADSRDMKALFNICYGLYLVTANDGARDNGIIINGVTQVADGPSMVAVTMNKTSLSHDIIMNSRAMNVCCLSVDAPYKLFESFGMQSGRDTDKFAGWDTLRSENGLTYLPQYINAFMSLKVEQTIDMSTRTMFICSVTEARVISSRETMTNSYYMQNVRPKPQPAGKKRYVCKICGYVYEGDELPADFVCPLCKHPASDFELVE